ncbi:MAG: DUF2877 domain-containing protein [Bacteroidales bacterium]|nr:DUF2877 domain-containing protein [Bacteroidales bacterium]
MIIEIGDCIFEGIYSSHSIFNNITNFINDEKNIVSLADDEKYLSPNSIIISGGSHKNVTSIIINSEEIIIDKKSFNKKELKKYNASIDFKNSEFKSIIKRAEIIIKENISEFNPLSLAFLIEEKLEQNFETRFQKAFVKHIKSAWKEIEKGKIISGVKKVKGSGMGLTPSGDDFITGILYAVILIGESKNIDTSKIRKIIYEAARSNNEISRNMIYHASIGAYFKQFKDLQIALINNDKNIKDYLINLIEIGETSGSDMLTGFFLSLKYLKNKI